MDSDKEDFVFIGTQIKCEEGLISRKNKTIAESSNQLQTLPICNQEVSVSSFNHFAEISL